MKKIFFILLLSSLLIINTSSAEYTPSLKTINNNIISYINTNYHISLHIKNNIPQTFPNFTTTEEYSDELINSSLKTLLAILKKFPPTFFNNFYQFDYNGLNIYFVNKINSSELNASAYSLDYQKKYMLVLAITEPNLEKIICHELMHNIEYHILKTKEPFSAWETYNPPNFYYTYSYTKPTNFNYTLKDIPENIYFLDTYSHTYPEEDRARIFENICAYQANLSYYPNLQAKALYLQKELINTYPDLKTSLLFQNLT